MSLRPESSGMVSGAHFWEPQKSCSLSAFLPEPKDKPGLGEALVCLCWSAAKTACTAECTLCEGRPLQPCPRAGTSQGFSLPGVSAEIASVSVLQMYSHSFSFASWPSYFLGFASCQKVGKQLGNFWIRSNIWSMMQQSRKMGRRHLGLKRSQRGWERAGVHCIICSCSSVSAPVVAYPAVLDIFSTILLSHSLFFSPSNNSLPSKFTCNDWKFCAAKNIKILLQLFHMLGNIKSSLN